MRDFDCEALTELSTAAGCYNLNFPLCGELQKPKLNGKLPEKR